MSILSYFLTFLVFILIDGVWLGFIARSMYAEQLGHLLKQDVNWAAAGIFYVLFVFGLLAFVIAPGLEKNSLRYVLTYGALFGLITYATYDLTNLATLKDWPLSVTIIDMCWGAVLSASVSAIAYLIIQRIG